MSLSQKKPKKVKNSITICCPICTTVKKIRIPDDFLENEIGALLPVEVERNQVCEHYFTALVDMNLNVRDYNVPKQRSPISQEEFELLIKKYAFN
jgi:hypothetical protein